MQPYETSYKNWQDSKTQIFRNYGDFSEQGNRLEYWDKILNDFYMPKEYSVFHLIDCIRLKNLDRISLCNVKVTYIHYVVEAGPENSIDNQLLGVLKLKNRWKNTVILPRDFQKWLRLVIPSNGWINGEFLFSLKYFTLTKDKDQMKKLKSMGFFTDLLKLKDCQIELCDDLLLIKKMKNFDQDDTKDLMKCLKSLSEKGL